VSVAEVLRLLVKLGEILGKNLLPLAMQVEPRLRTAPLPATDDAMDAARAEAIARLSPASTEDEDP
jgi:hypothetical protein